MQPMTYEQAKRIALDLAQRDSQYIFFAIDCMLRGMDDKGIAELLSEWYAHRRAIVTDPYI